MLVSSATLDFRRFGSAERHYSIVGRPTEAQAITPAKGVA
jgi:hypothetical protein